MSLSRTRGHGVAKMHAELGSGKVRWNYAISEGLFVNEVYYMTMSEGYKGESADDLG